MPLESAARRELKEETGFVAKKWDKLLEGPSTAGLTDECITIFHAHEMTRVTHGGGTGGEEIKVHIINVEDVNSWCGDRQAEGMLVDFKIFAALHLLKIRTGNVDGKLWY